MNKEMNSQAKSRLYGLTSVVCSFWLIQSIYETVQTGQKIFTLLHIIFYLSMLIVIGYTAYSSYEMYQISKQEKSTEMEENSEEV